MELTIETVQEEQVQEERFTIDSTDKANWYLRQLANIEAEQQRVRTQAAQIVKALEADAERLRYLFEGELQEFVRASLAATGNRKKSLVLLQGTAGFRTVPARLAVTDESAAVCHASSEGIEGAFVSNFSPSAYLAIAEETGELLPGVERIPARESFSVRFGKGVE